MARLKEKYNQEIKTNLQKKLGLSNAMEVPRIKKITVNMGIGEAIGDKNSGDTIIAEATEALIGAIYKCFNSIIEVNLWLDKFWEQDSEEFLKTPYKFNAKTSLQEWCQSKGIDLPVYKIIEITKNHGDPKRFFCEIYRLR